VDFELSDDQRAILEAVEGLLEQRAGAARAIALATRGAYDHELESALDEAGFLDVVLDENAGLLEAVMVVEAAARHGGVAAIGAAAIVAPALLGRRPPGPIALASREDATNVRYAAHARTLLVLDGDEARMLELDPSDAAAAVAVRSNFGLPVGRIEVDLRGGESLGPKSGPRLHALWQVAVAAECAGVMSAALQVTVDYARERRQFGRAIGSFQALQHRLAICKVRVEGTRWLAYEAAASDAQPEAAAAAAGYAADAARELFTETHQISGAMGFTREHDLHVWSMRLPLLAQDMGGASSHHRALARARWGADLSGVSAATG
jgi:alkylation response protein AidB-like acyl-CoA dehydrogenase